MQQQIILAAENDYPRLKDFAEKVGVDWPETDGETHFFMLEKAELAACIGVKIIENRAVLRVLIIDPEQCGLGETVYLVNSACKKAKEWGAVSVYFLTGAPSYIFQLIGFTEVSQTDLPERMLNCPPFNRIEGMKSATIMMRFLND